MSLMYTRAFSFFLFVVSCSFVFSETSFWDNWRQSPNFTGNWNGYRDKLHEKGLDIIPTWSMDFGWNLTNSKKKRFAYQYLFDLNVQIDSGPWTHQKGGLLYADFQVHHGTSLTQDLQVVQALDSYIDAKPFVQLSELWYRQPLFHDKVSIKVGKSDAAEEFDNSYYGTPFLNAGFESIGSILYFPTYPFPAMGVVIMANPVSWFTMTGAIFDGSLAEGVNTGTHGISRFFHHLSSHAFLILETDFQWSPAPYTGKLGIGIWDVTAKLTTFSGSKKKGTAGMYLFLDQCLHRFASQGQLGFFGQYGFSNPKVNIIEQSLAFGFNASGMVKSLPRDVCGIGLSNSFLSQEKGAGFDKRVESVIEVFYQWTWIGWLTVQPDLQYVIHPNGRNESNTLIGLLHLSMVF
jgi:porin